MGRGWSLSFSRDVGGCPLQLELVLGRPAEGPRRSEEAGPSWGHLHSNAPPNECPVLSRGLLSLPLGAERSSQRPPGWSVFPSPEVLNLCGCFHQLWLLVERARWPASPPGFELASCLPRPESLQDADRLPSVLLLRLIHLFGAVLAGGKVGWEEPVGQGVAVLGSLCWVNPLPISAHTCRRTGRRL